MKEIQKVIKVYDFNELSEEAREKVCQQVCLSSVARTTE